MTAFFSGFALSLSFILAIGPQNAFVLRQGIRREHVFLVVMVCAISEVLLIGIGVAGFGVFSDAPGKIVDVISYLGAGFLFFYGASAFRSAFWGEDALEADARGATSWRSALATILAVTWLNPHAFLDTAVLIGSISMQYGDQRYVFGAGAALASILFFFGLGYGAALLAPIFGRPRAWRVLDGVVGASMWIIAIGLIL